MDTTTQDHVCEACGSERDVRFYGFCQECLESGVSAPVAAVLDSLNAPAELRDAMYSCVLRGTSVGMLVSVLLDAAKELTWLEAALSEACPE